jgi:hypothetical protein
LEAGPLLLPGIKINTSPADHVPVDQAQFVPRNGGLGPLRKSRWCAKPLDFSRAVWSFGLGRCLHRPECGKPRAYLADRVVPAE